MRHKKLTLVTLAFLSSIGQINSDLYLASLPDIAHHFGASVSASQFTLAIYMLGFSISQLIYGPLSDGIGRYRLIIFGGCVCVLGGIICSCAFKLNMLYGGRFLQGCGAGAGASLFRPILRDLYHGDELVKNVTTISLIGIAALTISPVFGGVIQYYYGWRMNFILLTTLTLITLMLICFFMSESNTYHHLNNLKPSIIRKNFRSILTNKAFLVFSTCSMLVYGAVVAWLTTGPVILQRTVGLDAIGYGWCYFITGLGFILGSLITGKVVTNIGRHKLLQFGFVCLFLSGALLCLFYFMGYVNVVVIVAPVTLLLFSLPFIFPATFACAFEPFPHIAGAAGALFGAQRMLGGALFSFLVALGSNKDQLSMGLAVIGAAVGCIILYFGVPREEPGETQR